MAALRFVPDKLRSCEGLLPVSGLGLRKLPPDLRLFEGKPSPASYGQDLCFSISYLVPRLILTYPARHCACTVYLRDLQ